MTGEPSSRCAGNLEAGQPACPGVFSDRIASVPASGTVALADKVKQMRREGKRILDLSVGQPDFPTPHHIVAAAEKALNDGKTGYGPSLGIPELREAVADRHTKDRDTPVAVGNVLVTPAKHALLTFFLTVLDPGDEVIIPTPAWVSYAPQVLMCGAHPIEVPTQPDGRLDLDAMAEAASQDTRAIVINSPSNPTGAVLPPEDVRGALDLAQETGCWLLSDEIYSELTYDGVEAPSPAALQGSLEGVAIVDGVSKSYAMTGWRIGWLIGPEALIENATKVQQHSVTHPTLFAQYGAVQALVGDQTPVEEMRQAFASRRRLMVDGLTGLGASFPEPRGAFYLFPTLPGFESGHELADQLLDQVGIAATPGEAFGAGGEGHVRLSYAASQETLEAALEGFETLLQAREA